MLRAGDQRHLWAHKTPATRKESSMRIGTIIAALLALLALVMPGLAYAGGAFALPPVACNIIIIILVIVVIYLLWTRRRP
jgi:protein-S-isoprenylcysteine O-methyltransferase Ste14